MRSIVLDLNQQQALQWTRDTALQLRIRRCRGTPLPGAGDSNAIVERALCRAQLDYATRAQLLRILTVTVQAWSRK